MNCEKCQELLSNYYFDGRFNEKDRASLEAHLEECADCNEVTQNLVLIFEYGGQPPRLPLRLRVRNTIESPVALKYPELPLSAQIDKLGPSSTLIAFLSHSSADKAAVRLLYKRLLNEGIKPWLAEEDLLPGQDWDHEIEKVLREADVVIACLSRESVKRRGYVQKEIRIALDIAKERPHGEIFLIPLRFEDCEVPTHLRHLHRVDYYEENGYERLRRTLKHCAEQK